MNKAVPFLEKMFFKNNVNKIRQTIIGYLKEEGIETELTDGVIIVILDELHYGIHFDLENDYPKCNIVFGLKSEDYETLELYQKTFIADKLTSEREKDYLVEFTITTSGRLYVSKIEEIVKRDPSANKPAGN